MRTVIIIPARYSSVRYPGKPLVKLSVGDGFQKSLIQLSWEAASRVENVDEVFVATDDKRIRVDFPHKFGNTEQKKSTAPVQTVASATRSVKPGRKTVRLTSSQVAIAKKLGVPLEEYAKQLKNTEGA